MKLIKGCLCRERWYRRFSRLKKRGDKKVREDMDLLNVLRVMRQNTVKLWCIMTKP